MPLRTRACLTCRKRRIKCDATLPHCLMCKRTGKSCPGPLDGPLIVDMTANAKAGMKKRRQTDIDHAIAMHDSRGHHLDINPLVSTATTIAFFEKFLSLFTTNGENRDIGNQLTWLDRLPRLTASKSDPALVLALEATATAYGAIMSASGALTRQAHISYGTALRAHQAVLQKRGSSGDITIHMVSTSVCLSLFEAMQATTADAYRAHIYGAARLLEITGPGECGHGVLCQLFYHVRTQMLFIQLATNSCNVPLSAKKILYDTLLYKDPPMIQKLMCHITALLDLRAGCHGRPESLVEDLAFLKSGVDQLWLEYSAHKPDNRTDDMETFNDAFTALTVAYFSAARIISWVIMLDVANTAAWSRQSQVILNVASFVDVTRNAFAFMRMATPLLLVALHAQSREHRESVMSIFELWAKRSMKGISVLALDAVRRAEQKSS